MKHMQRLTAIKQRLVSLGRRLAFHSQEDEAAAHREELKTSLAIGVGCVLDVLAGTFTRAPQ